MATEVFITASLDLVIKANTDPAVAITVLDSAGSAYDFSNETDIDFIIYDYEGGAQIIKYDEHASEGVSYSSNIVTWNATWANLATILPAGFYYYIITYEDSALTNPTQKICDGQLEVK